MCKNDQWTCFEKKKTVDRPTQDKVQGGNKANLQKTNRRRFPVWLQEFLHQSDKSFFCFQFGVSAFCARDRKDSRHSEDHKCQAFCRNLLCNSYLLNWVSNPLSCFLFLLAFVLGFSVPVLRPVLCIASNSWLPLNLNVQVDILTVTDLWQNHIS